MVLPGETTLTVALLLCYPSDVFIETGTSDGNGVQIALDAGFRKIFSIEIDSRKVLAAQQRFSELIQKGIVSIIEGDSVNILPQIINNIGQLRATFWLDAHWDNGPQGVKRCPLYDELESIKSHKRNDHNILIDDRRIFGIPGSNWGEGISEQAIISLCFTINKLYNKQLHDGVVPDDIICFSVPDKTHYIIDAGAHRGDASDMFLAKYPDAHIIAFEPSSSLYRDLSIKYNKQCRVNISQLAIAERNGYFDFISDSPYSQGGTISKIHNLGISSWNPTSYETHLVKAVSLSEIICAMNRMSMPIIIKLDIESAEYPVLQSLLSSRALCRNITSIYCEFHSKYMDVDNIYYYQQLEKIFAAICINYDVNLYLWQ